MVTSFDHTDPDEAYGGFESGRSARRWPFSPSPAFDAIVTLGILQIGILGLTLVRSKVIAVFLHPQGVGVISVIDQVVQLLIQICGLSLAVAPMKFLAQALRDGLEAAGKMYRLLLTLLLASTLVGAALSAGIVAVWPDVLGRELRPYHVAFLVGVAAIPSMAMGGLLASVIAVGRGYRASSFYALLLGGGGVLAAYVGISVGGVLGLYVGNVLISVGGAAGAIVYIWYAMQLAPRADRSVRRLAAPAVPGLVSFSGVFYVMGFVQPLSLLAARYAVVGSRGVAAAGLMQAGLAIASIVSLLLAQSIRLYLWPVLNRAGARDEKFNRAREFHRTFVLLAALAALPIVVFPRELTLLLYSSAFTDIAGYLFLFAVAEFLFANALVYQAVVVGIDAWRELLLTGIVAHAILAGLAWPLAPLFGIGGVAWAFVISRAVLLLSLVALLRWRHGFRYKSGLSHVSLGAFVLVAVGVTAQGLYGSAWGGPARLATLLTGSLILLFGLQSHVWKWPGRHHDLRESPSPRADPSDG